MNNERDLKIVILPTRKVYAKLDARDEQHVREVIEQYVLPQMEAEYYRVNVRIKRKTDETPEALVAYMLRKDIYKAEVVKVDLKGEYKVKNVVFEYDDSGDFEEEEEEYGEDTGEAPVFEDFSEGGEKTYALDFVIGTPCDDIPTAKQAVDFLFSLTQSLGFKSKKLLGPQATVANYKMYLKSGLKAFINIGHGNPNLIALHDGNLTATWLNSLSGHPLKPGVIYFNSCQVCNAPMKDAIIHAGGRTFIGGIVNLLIGPSENVCKCFWNKVLKVSIGMKDALTKCEKDKYPSEGAHGILGDLNLFMKTKLKLAQAMWIHGTDMHVEYPDRISWMRRMGFYFRLRGKPFTSNWFHFAIPSTVILNQKRLNAGSVMLVFRTYPGVRIHAVHVYDGPYRIAQHDGLTISTNGKFVFRRFDIPTHPAMKFGLGISIGIKFADGANLPSTKHLVDFSSAGCDFVTKEVTTLKAEEVFEELPLPGELIES